MTTMNRFEPDWASPPGATVLNLLQERGYTVRAFAGAVERDIHQLSRLLYGIERLTQDWAVRLSHALGASPDFWLRREELYRRDLDRLTKPAIEASEPEWLIDVPLRDMVRFGWIEDAASRNELLISACAFFGVTSSESFHRRYGDVLAIAAYRSSTAFETKPAAVATWLRQGEILAGEIDCAPWNADSLSASLDHLRSLTRESDPAKFLPTLVETLAASGVAVVVARAPDGCRASGATRFLSPQKAVMQMSFRYLTDDQFWMTAFHEIGHLLLHRHGELFLEGIETTSPNAESEAEDFARTTLFAKASLRELHQLPLNKFSIARFARRAGVSSGLVVGRLQEIGRAPYKHFNYLKARYAWPENQTFGQPPK